ncbi:hypothetical protein C9374_002286 [Naegleria lovaniensis]|uniref:Uncharacterized protein n=1 Tax=Naegleria lovaniensis TaxID=51637 RepID=A0AA88GPL6_NAELO|nr:uncharacterized protein C9374_002286 [Naegleria lovaniensis]KAG2386542.1 hypothetical protein C9374_002286 [Naegleria lovaniensis]
MSFATSSSSFTLPFSENFHPNGQDILQMQKEFLTRPFKIICLESLQISSQQHYILLGDDNGRLLIFDFSKLEFVSICEIHHSAIQSIQIRFQINEEMDEDTLDPLTTNPITCLDNNPRECFIYTASHQSIKVWKFKDLLMKSQNPIFTITPSLYKDSTENSHHGEIINCMKLVDPLIYIGFDNGYIYGIDMNTTKLEHVTRITSNNNGQICGVAIHSIQSHVNQNTQLFVGCADGLIRIVHSSLGNVSTTIIDPFGFSTSGISTCNFSLDEPNGHWLLASSMDTNFMSLYSVKFDLSKPARIIMSGKTSDVKIAKDCMVSLGGANVYYWNRDGTLQLKLETHLEHLYSIIEMEDLNPRLLVVIGVLNFENYLITISATQRHILHKIRIPH